MSDLADSSATGADNEVNFAPGSNARTHGMKQTTTTPAAWSLVTALIPVSLSLQAADPAKPAVPAPATAAANAPASGWSVTASLAVKETFDDNIYLLNQNSPVPPPPGQSWAPAYRSSWVTSAQPVVGVSYQAGAAFKATVNYAGDYSYYTGASTENNLANKGTVNFGGKLGETTWELANLLTYIDGSDLGLFFDPALGGPPAAGGVPIRDRRDAFVDRNILKVAIPAGNWVFRPTASFYVHDFLTQQHTVAEGTQWRGYQSYIDRNETAGGLDVGYKALRNAFLLVGYRYGRQNQEQLVNVSSPYDNNFQRVLVGVDGKIAPWLSTTLLLGPDFRTFPSASLPPGVASSETTFFCDAAITVAPGKNDSVVVTARMFQQPSFGSLAMYDDITCEAGWKHRFSPKLLASVGFRAYCTDFLLPARRVDWILTPTAVIAYAFDKHLTAEASYFHDSSFSDYANTPNRIYDRNVIALGLKYVFK